MGGGDHNARHATQMLHGKRKLRHGMQRGEQIGLNPVCGKNAGCLLRKLRRKQAGVIRDANPALLCARAGEQIVAQPLRGAAHDIDIHAIGARAENTA
ncbi:hypothetical protein SDC9_132762 [bioreactor metagenome]|uniref:Uncharacterized protein n=1 Tax=bioreactor metagenome TaxID=1076179 RepID=A0A645D8T7_9ZZZZ